MADRIWFIASFPSPVIFRYHLPLKDVQATEEAFSLQKRTSSTSKNEIYFFFSIFAGHFCPPESGCTTLFTNMQTAASGLFPLVLSEGVSITVLGSNVSSSRLLRFRFVCVWNTFAWKLCQILNLYNIRLFYLKWWIVLERPWFVGFP